MTLKCDKDGVWGEGGSVINTPGFIPVQQRIGFCETFFSFRSSNLISEENWLEKGSELRA